VQWQAAIADLHELEPALTHLRAGTARGMRWRLFDQLQLQLGDG